MRIRSIAAADREFFIDRCHAFYKTPACDHEIPQQNAERTFELLLHGTPYADCLIDVYKRQLLERMRECEAAALDRLCLLYTSFCHYFCDTRHDILRAGQGDRIAERKAAGMVADGFIFRAVCCPALRQAHEPFTF